MCIRDRDYIERSSEVTQPEDINKYLIGSYEKFKHSLSQNNLDEYCYSQIEQNLKELIIRGEDKDYKYIYPSIILKAVVILYNKKSYLKVVDICKNCIASLEFWDPVIRQTLYFYYAMSLARNREHDIFEILYKKICGEYILEKFQADFIRGFYYKLSGRYDDAEKQLGITAAFMGLIGITEGAIPFAVKDIKHVLPAICLGSAVGAGLAMMHAIDCYVPHGGMIVVAATSKPLLYTLDMAIGVVVTAIALMFIKPNLEDKKKKAEAKAVETK